MTKASDNAFPSILITEGTEPSAPAAGKQRLYIDSTTHKLKRTDSSGTDVTIEGTAETLPVTIIDAKGDIIAGTAADTASRLAVGSNGKVLTANSAQSTGLEWVTPTAGATTPVADDVTRTAGDFTTTSTTFVDVTSMSLTITTEARRVMIGFVGSAYTNNTAGTWAMDIDIDGTRVSGAADGCIVVGTNVASESQNASFTFLTKTALTAASHTFKLQARVFNGAHTLTVNANTNDPAYFWVAEQMHTA